MTESDSSRVKLKMAEASSDILDITEISSAMLLWNLYSFRPMRMGEIWICDRYSMMAVISSRSSGALLVLSRSGICSRLRHEKLRLWYL